MYIPMEATAHAAWALAHVYYRPKAAPGRPQDHESTGFHRRARHGGVVGTAAFLREARCRVLEHCGDGVWRARERAHRVAESPASKGTRGHYTNAGRGSDRDLKKWLF